MGSSNARTDVAGIPRLATTFLTRARIHVNVFSLRAVQTRTEPVFDVDLDALRITRGAAHSLRTGSGYPRY